MRTLILALVLSAVATVAACTSPTTVVLCFEEVVIVDTVTQEPVVDEPLYRIQQECETEEDNPPAIISPR